MIYRQGDVLLKPINKIPNGVKPKNLVLAEGEITGHYHQFVDQASVAVFELNGQQYVEVQTPADLVHDEHGTLVIDAGLYEVVPQREVDLLNEIQRVMD